MVDFFSLRPLPRSTRPCLVTRHRGRVLATIHPGVRWSEVLAVLEGLLSRQELEVFRAAVGYGPDGMPVPSWLSEALVLDDVPPCLQTPAERRRTTSRWALELLGRS